MGSSLSCLVGRGRVDHGQYRPWGSIADTSARPGANCFARAGRDRGVTTGPGTLEGVPRHLLRDLPQPAPEDRRDWRSTRWMSTDVARARRGVGEGGRQAARRPDAAVRHAAAGAGGDRRLRRHRSRRRSIAPRRPIPNPGRTEPFHRLNRAEYQNAIRDLLGARDRRDDVAADRRDQLRLRQHRRRPEAVAAADRALSQRRAEGVAARPRHAGAAQRRPVSRARPARSGCPPRGHAGRHARRHAGRLPRAPETASTTSRCDRAAASTTTSRTSSASSSSKSASTACGCRCSRVPATPGRGAQHRAPGGPGAGPARPRARRGVDANGDPLDDGTWRGETSTTTGSCGCRSRPACTRFARPSS